MKNLTNTLTKAETEVIDLIRDQVYASHLGMLYADTDRAEHLNYRNGTVTIPLKKTCFRLSDGWVKHNVNVRMIDVVNTLKASHNITVTYGQSRDYNYSIVFKVPGYHQPKTVNLPKNYGKGSLNGCEQKVAKLAAILKDLWGYNKREYVYSVRFYLHDGDKVVKTSTCLSFNGYFNYTEQEMNFYALREAARVMSLITDEHNFEFFVPDSATIHDGETKDEYNFDL
jgi:hypothetical protein